jgi:hypothetical protein
MCLICEKCSLLFLRYLHHGRAYKYFETFNLKRNFLQIYQKRNFIKFAKMCQHMVEDKKRYKSPYTHAHAICGNWISYFMFIAECLNSNSHSVRKTITTLAAYKKCLKKMENELVTLIFVTKRRIKAKR